MQELKFRDGHRTVPDHVEALLSGIETWKYTYREALRVANNNLLGDRVARVERELIRNHFKVTP